MPRDSSLAHRSFGSDDPPDLAASTTAPKRSLPAERHAAQIVAKVQEHPVVFVSGSTGCGKSTKVPQALLREFGGCVLCTQPRRLAVVAVASRVAEELREIVGKGTVGMAIGRQVRISKETRVLSSTAGCMVEELKSKGEAALRQYSVIVIDEVHERSIENELLVTIVKVGTDTDTDTASIVGARLAYFGSP